MNLSQGAQNSAASPGKKIKNHILVARGTDLVVIRVVGAGNMVTAPILHEFAEGEFREGFRRFVFDMCHCRGLDSTFMGCMVGLSNKVSGADAEGGETPGPQELSPEDALKVLHKMFSTPPDLSKRSDDKEPDLRFGNYVIAVNVSAECKELMNILGVDNFVQIRGEVELGGLEMAMLADKEIPVEERRKLILTAHENLVEIDQRNEEKFGAFLRTLSEELAKESRT